MFALAIALLLSLGIAQRSMASSIGNQAAAGTMSRSEGATTKKTERARLPGYSWDTLPVHWFSANITSQFTPSEAARIVSSHSLVIVNGQDHAYGVPPVGRRAEVKMVQAARILKRAAAELPRATGNVHHRNDEVTVLAYFNAVLDWTTYDLHEWVLRDDESRALHDVDGRRHYGRTDNFNNTIGTFDLTNPEVRSRWIRTLVNITEDPCVDGVFIDQGDYDQVPHGPQRRIDPVKLQAWHRGHREMITDLREAMPPGSIILLNNHSRLEFPSGYDHEYEDFKGTVEDIRSLQRDGRLGRLATVRNGFNGTFHRTLPAFLLGAGDNAYYAAPFDYAPEYRFPGWTEPAWDERRPEYGRALGEPLGEATVDGDVWTRHFASGTYVVLNVSEAEGVGGCVYWSDGTITGHPQFCSHDGVDSGGASLDAGKVHKGLLKEEISGNQKHPVEFGGRGNIAGNDASDGVLSAVE